MPHVVDARGVATADSSTREAPGLSPKVCAEEELGARVQTVIIRSGSSSSYQGVIIRSGTLSSDQGGGTGGARIPERTMRTRSWPLCALATSLLAFQLWAPIDVTGGEAVFRNPEGTRSFHPIFSREPPQPRGQASATTTAARSTHHIFARDKPQTRGQASATAADTAITTVTTTTTATAITVTATASTATAAAAATAFLSAVTPPSTTRTPTPKTSPYPRPAKPSPPIARRAARKRPPHTPALAGAILSPGDGGNLAGVGGISLWLDMRTSPLPAAQTLQTLYNDLREREIALERNPDDPDWPLRRVPNPVGALLYASESGGRPAEEMEALGGVLPCFQLGNDSDDVLEVPSGDVVGVGIDPVEGGGGAGAGPAIAAVAAAQQTGGGEFVVLRGVRPSAWEGGDMNTVLQIAASACAGSGKTLVVSVRSVGQLHDAAMAALAASQTQVLGRAADEGPEGGTVVLLIEPEAEIWEAGLLYL